MSKAVLALGITVLANLVYHFSQKRFDRNASALSILCVTYLVAFGLSLICLIVERQRFTIVRDLMSGMNTGTLALGASIFFVELGFFIFLSLRNEYWNDCFYIESHRHSPFDSSRSFFLS